LKLFLWKIAWDIVPSKIRLNQVFPINLASLVCPLCKVAEDSLHHLFFSCFFARISWRSSPWPLDSLKWTSLILSDRIKGILTPHSFFGIPLVDSHHFQIFTAVFCDLMWFYINQAVHNGILLEGSKLVAYINRVSLEHLAVWTSKLSPLRELWSPPPPDSYKINFDTAIKDDFSSQAAVCRNTSGKIIKILTQIRPACSSAYGEALVALLASSLTVSLNLAHFVLEGDSAIVITALQDPFIILDWQLDHIICNIFSLIRVSSTWKARKVNRNENFCAHYVANRAAVGFVSNGIPSLSSPPLSIPICSRKDPPPSLPS
jgi:hypothetical protein